MPLVNYSCLFMYLQEFAYVCSTHEGHKRALGATELELHIVMSFHVVSGDRSLGTLLQEQQVLLTT